MYPGLRTTLKWINLEVIINLVIYCTSLQSSHVIQTWTRTLNVIKNKGDILVLQLKLVPTVLYLFKVSLSLECPNHYTLPSFTKITTMINSTPLNGWLFLTFTYSIYYVLHCIWPCISITFLRFNYVLFVHLHCCTVFYDWTIYHNPLLLGLPGCFQCLFFDWQITLPWTCL